MRAIVVTAVATLVVAGSAGAVSGAAQSRPSLQVTARAVHGAHFRPSEAVRLAFAGAVDSVRRVRATPAGSFAAAVPPYDPCTGPLTIVATGARGDSARLKLPQRACSPAD